MTKNLSLPEWLTATLGGQDDKGIWPVDAGSDIEMVGIGEGGVYVFRRYGRDGGANVEIELAPRKVRGFIRRELTPDPPTCAEEEAQMLADGIKWR